MTRQQLLKLYESLPATARHRVDEFVASLAEEKPREPKRTATSPKSISDEPFVGMWQNRTDLDDSTEWVRSLRSRHWSRRIG